MSQSVKKSSTDHCEVECTHPEVVARVSPLAIDSKPYGHCAT